MLRAIQTSQRAAAALTRACPLSRPCLPPRPQRPPAHALLPGSPCPALPLPPPPSPPAGAQSTATKKAVYGRVSQVRVALWPCSGPAQPQGSAQLAARPAGPRARLCARLRAQPQPAAAPWGGGWACPLLGWRSPLAPERAELWGGRAQPAPGVRPRLPDPALTPCPPPLPLCASPSPPLPPLPR